MNFRNECSCRVCGGENLTEIVNIGRIPLSDHGVWSQAVDETLLHAPLTLVFCQSCALVQLRESLKFDMRPSAAQPADAQGRNAQAFADMILRRWPLTAANLVIEAGSRDGVQLEAFAQRGIPVLGLEPEIAAAKMALKKGIDTWLEPFTQNLAGKLVLQDKAADIFLAHNILSTVADLNGFVAGIKTILIPRGAAVIDVPYVVDMVENAEISSLSHQQRCYFSLQVLDGLFRQHGLFLNDAERISSLQGGLRIFIQPFEAVELRVTALLAEESAQQVDQLSYYKRFSQRCAAKRQQQGYHQHGGKVVVSQPQPQIM